VNLRQLLFVSLLGCIASPAHAVTYCVNSVSGLNAAFNSANAAAEGSEHEIRVRPGNYALPGGLEFNPAGDKDAKDFSLTGGWNSGCTARTINASATVFNGENGSVDADFRFVGNNSRYVIEGIRFINFRDFDVDDANCNFDCPDTDVIRLRYNEFRDGTSVHIRAKDAQQLTVTNNLFADLSPGGGSAVALSYVNNESPPTIAFNTVAGILCSSGGDALYLFTQRSGVTLHHNLVQQVGCVGNITVAGGSGGQPVALRNNLYNTLAGLAPSVAIGNVVTNTPNFVNSGAGDYRLKETAPASPAINAGMTPTEAATLGLSGQVPSQDLDGPAGARQIGTRYDIGAYESSINDSSVLTVVNENDSGAGSLRAQIAAANAAPGLQKIEFAIPGGCTQFPHLILLQSPLPDITDSLVIDGYSEPESAANTLSNGSDAVLCVVIAAQSGTLAQALQVPDGAAGAGTSLTVKGLAFAGATGFNGNFTVALRLRGGQNHLVQGNAFAGTGPGAIGPLGTLGFGIQIRDSAQNVLVGGADPEHRNSFGSMSSSAIVLNDASSGGHTIQNNYIGLTASGISASPIGLNGIFASNSPNVKILDNVIAAVASSAAISITGATATGYTIARNRIGVSAFGAPGASLRNGVGIQIANGSGGHVIGSLIGLAASNTITNSDDAGVWILPTAGTGNVVRPNRIFGNGISGLGLGIDIGPLGQSTNDPLDPDGGANNGQNWPQVTASLPNADGSRTATVTLDSKANTSYRIDVYRSPDCPAGNRGANLLNRVGTITGTSNASGQFSPTFVIDGAGAPGILSAVATSLATNDSSEPGLCFIEPAASTTTITNDTPDPSQVGQPYTVTVLVTSASGTPTGTMTISDGQGSQCSDETIVGGIASCQLLSTSVGNKTLTASYSGSFTHAPSSDTAPHQVIAATTTTTIVSDAPDPSQVGQAYTVAVEVRTAPGNLAIPGGQVAVSDGSGQTCQIASLSNGNGSCQLTSVVAGNKTLSASYAGAVNFLASSDTEAHTVVPATTITTITSDAPDPSLPGQTYVVAVNVTSAAGTPTGSVAVNDGAGASCNITLASGGGSCQLASATVGNKTLTATYTPASQAYAGSSDTESHTVALAATTTTITSDAPDPSGVGQVYLVEVQVTSAAGTPTGAVTVNDGSGASCNANLNSGFALCEMVSTSGGNKTLTATYAGDANFSGSSDTEGHAVSAIATTTTILSDNPDPSPVGVAYTVVVSVAAGFGTPGGSVNVDDGVSANCQITLNQGGGSCQLTSTVAGPKTLTATYVGNASYLGSSDTESHTVSPGQAAATTTTITADTPEPSVPGQPYTVSVTVSSQAGTPSGTVIVNDGAGAGASECQLNLVNGSGSCQLTSQFAGGRVLTACLQASANWAASCDNEVHDTIKADTSLDSPQINPSPAVEGQVTQVSIALQVLSPGAGTPTGTVTVSASASEQCTIQLPATSCGLTLTSPGARNITASYGGDGNFNGSQRQTTVQVLADQLLRNGFED